MEQTRTDFSDSFPNEKQNFYAIDGSNLAFEIRDSQNKPRFSNILKLQETLRKSDIFNYRIICDRSLYYCIDEKSNYSKVIQKGLIIESPEGTTSDIFILQLAYEKNGYIISNDKFKDFYSIYDEAWIENYRISFKIIDEEIYFNKIIIKGGEKYGKKR